MLLTFDEIITKLGNIIQELNSREHRKVSLYAELAGKEWDELCDIAIALIKELGGE